MIKDVGVEKVTLISRKSAVQGVIGSMYCLIFIRGGLLIMMGQHTRSEALFY